MLDERLDERVPGLDRVTELVRRDGLVGEAARVQVVERRLAVAALGQDAVVEGDRGVERVAQPLALRVLAAGALAELDAGTRRQAAQRLGEVDRVALHDEVEDVAAAAAAEALPGFARRSDGERRRLLAVERAQALERGASLASWTRLADELNEVELLLDLCGNAD